MGKAKLMLALHCVGDSTQPPLVLLHGFLGNAQDWASLLPTLSQHFYCIAADLPGHGDSGAITVTTPGFHPSAHLLLQALDAMGIDKFHLLGYSLGGRIALHVAAIAATRLLSLQLESCHPGLQQADAKQQRASADAQWAERLQQLPLSQFLELWYQQAVFAELSPIQRQQLQQLRQPQHPAGLLAMYRATSLALQQDLWSLPQQLSCPVHYYYGEHDHKFAAVAQRWQPQGVISHPVANASHNSHQTNPQHFLHLLLAALAPKMEKPA